MSFKPGEKVVCINDKYDLSDPILVSLTWPVKYKTYTVRESGDGVVWLEEITNKEIPMDFGGMVLNTEPGFAENRFVTLQEFIDSLTNSSHNSKGEDVKEYEYLEVEETELV